MMKVYILTAEYYDDKYVEGVFSSYSAMITYLKNTYDYESEVVHFANSTLGSFIESTRLGVGIVE